MGYGFGSELTSSVSEPTFPSNPVFENPLSVPVATGQNPAAVNLTNPGGGRIGGIGQLFTLTSTFGTTEVQNVVLTGESNRLNVDAGAANITAISGGQIIESAPLLSASGTVIKDAPKNINLTTQVDPATGVNLPFNGVGVSLDAEVQGNLPTAPDISIRAAAGGQTGTFIARDGTVQRGFAFYASGGTGDDQISGSGESDFLRGGTGNDFINANGGNDLVRGGAGADTIFLGTGQDTLYYTLDQIDGSIDILRDFSRTGTNQDVITYGANISAQIINGGQSIVFTALSGSLQGATTTLTSRNADDTGFGVLFTDSDVIRFLG